MRQNFLWSPVVLMQQITVSLLKTAKSSHCYFSGRISYESRTFSCTMKHERDEFVKHFNERNPKVVLYFVCFSLPFLIMICSFSGVLWKTRQTLGNIPQLEDKSARLEKQITRTARIICGSFVCCLLPSFLVSTFHTMPPNTTLPGLHIASYFLLWCTTFLNPIIYFFTNDFYKKQMKETGCFAQFFKDAIDSPNTTEMT